MHWLERSPHSQKRHLIFLESLLETLLNISEASEIPENAICNPVLVRNAVYICYQLGTTAYECGFFLDICNTNESAKTCPEIKTKQDKTSLVYGTFTGKTNMFNPGKNTSYNSSITKKPTSSRVLSFNESSIVTMGTEFFRLKTRKYQTLRMIENGPKCFRAKIFKILTMEKAGYGNDNDGCYLICKKKGKMCRDYSFDPVNGCWLHVFKPVCYCSPSFIMTNDI